ncbi:MAG: citrate/2-methylcitrate synthase [Spirochaetaceae bacterium]|nr:MAG: citrate/2-methylcitrate synthase [Spirochaetaceae bacterium]
MNHDEKLDLKIDKDLLEELTRNAEKMNRIPLDLYQKYSVKRGLRNEDGTGVLVGLTEIGDVHGYIIDEGQIVPVDGRLEYRGINILDITRGFQAEKRYGFEEVCYLLLFGTLPNRQQLEQFTTLLGENRALPNGFTENMILKAPSREIVNKLARSVLVCYSYDPNPDELDLKNVLRQSIELIARFPTMAAYGYQAKSHYFDGKSLFIHRPQKNLCTAENLLHLIRADSKFTQLEAEILDLALVLHAEHGGGNNSTFTTHVVTSTGTDTYSAIAAAVGSLKGPLHGGANLKVLDMMEDVKSQVKNWQDDQEIADYLAKILRKETFDGQGLIYGIGHAVYTLSDPRAVLLKSKAKELAVEKGRSEEFNLYERVARLSPEVFSQVKNSSKVVSANVDFYSGLVYEMLDIPKELYTPIFCVARIAGWCAHRIEELISGGRIIRPAYRNVLHNREYLPIEQR